MRCDSVRPIPRPPVAGGHFLDDFHRIADRRQRVAQFVRQHGQELVLALAGLDQPLLDSAALDDFALQAAVKARVLQGRCGVRHQRFEHRAAAGGKRRIAFGPGHEHGAQQPFAIDQGQGGRGGGGGAGNERRQRRHRLGRQVDAGLVAQRRLQGRAHAAVECRFGPGIKRRRAAARLADRQPHRRIGELFVQAGDRRKGHQLGHEQMAECPQRLVDLQRTVKHAAGLRQERRPTVVVLGRSPGRIGGDQGRLRVGLPAHLLLHRMQLHEDLHLAAQHFGHHRREDVVDRAERVAARGLHLVGIGRDEDDRRVRRALVLSDQRRGLETVDVGHVDVEQDHREFTLEQHAQRLASRSNQDHLLCQRFEHRGEDHQLLDRSPWATAPITRATSLVGCCARNRQVALSDEASIKYIGGVLHPARRVGSGADTATASRRILGGGGRRT